mmetsp:Transcript_6789/g.27260  ORF Transcript_6789/g.27260 Transcript_6789/m.27260 type:complete len:202 (+) Transcript_6789:525-1130(+)
MPSPSSKFVAASTAHRSPAPTRFTAVTRAGTNSNFSLDSPPNERIASANARTSAGSFVRKHTPSTPVSNASSITRASAASCTHANSALSIGVPANAATKFSAGMMDQPSTQSMTNTSPSRLEAAAAAARAHSSGDLITANAPLRAPWTRSTIEPSSSATSNSQFTDFANVSASRAAQTTVVVRANSAAVCTHCTFDVCNQH